MLKINDILAALSLQTALSPDPFPTISEKLSDARTFNILRCDNLLSVAMQNMASSPFYLLLVVSTNFLSSNVKPVSLLDDSE